MRTCILLLFIFLQSTSFSQLTDQEIRYRKEGHYKPDTSFIYHLPYKEGRRFLFIQGANSGFSHQHELSFDFKMKMHSGVYAARSGVVVAVKEDSDKGGLKPEFLSEGNHIIIRHIDGSEAQYWHLSFNGAIVNIGDTVTEGQLIGYSGNTGYTAFPHLHFQVVSAEGKEILPRFITKRGVKYIRPGRWYKAVGK